MKSVMLRLNDNRGKEQFEISLRQVFVSLNTLMHDASDVTLVIQGAALRYFPTTIADVITVFDPQSFWCSLMFFSEMVLSKRENLVGVLINTLIFEILETFRTKRRIPIVRDKSQN